MSSKLDDAWTSKISKTVATNEHLFQPQELHISLSYHLLDAQTRHKNFVDNHCLKPSRERPKFEFGDPIWFLENNIKHIKLYNKLDYQCLYNILLDQWSCILSWSPSLYVSSSNVPCTTLEPYYTSSIPNNVIPPQPPVELVDGPNYEVETILGSTCALKEKYYLVDWLSYTRNGQTWGPFENLTNVTKFILEFHHWYPNKTHPSLCIATGGNVLNIVCKILSNTLLT